jgi:hypothetical protein
MSGEQSGMLWLFMDVVLVLGLGAGLVYGLLRWRSARRTGTDQRADAATDRLYHQSEAQADREAPRTR